MKKFLSLVLCFVLLFSIAGCGFKVEHSDLYTVALNSLLWIRGASFQSDCDGPPYIEILETDSYGRVLFSYREKSWGDKSFASVLIMQKVEDGYVYFYPDVNFFSVESTKNMQVPVVFPDENIETLKQNNDWEKEIDLSVCTKKAITEQSESFEAYYENGRDTETISIISDVIKPYNPNGDVNWYFYKGMCDDHGRTIFHGYVGDQKMAILFMSDMTYNFDTCFFIPDDLYHYQDEFRKFKEQNNWNQPLE